MTFQEAAEVSADNAGRGAAACADVNVPEKHAVVLFFHVEEGPEPTGGVH